MTGFIVITSVDSYIYFVNHLFIDYLPQLQYRWQYAFIEYRLMRTNVTYIIFHGLVDIRTFVDEDVTIRFNRSHCSTFGMKVVFFWTARICPNVLIIIARSISVTRTIIIARATRAFFIKFIMTISICFVAPSIPKIAKTAIHRIYIKNIYIFRTHINLLWLEWIKHWNSQRNSK